MQGHGYGSCCWHQSCADASRWAQALQVRPAAGERCRAPSSSSAVFREKRAKMITGEHLRTKCPKPTELEQGKVQSCALPSRKEGKKVLQGQSGLVLP